MNPNVLIVFNDANEYDNTRDILREDLVKDLGEIEDDWEKNAAMAIGRLQRKRYQLLITGLHIPRDQKSAVVEEANSGIELLKNAQKYDIPSLLVVPAKTQELQEAVDELHRCRLVEKGSRYTKQLLKFSRMFLQSAQENIAETQTEKVGNIDLVLDLHQDHYFYDITGDYQDYGLLEIQSHRISDLIDRSCNIQDIKNWEKELQQIGKTLFEEILKNNYKFSSSFNKLSAKVGKKDRIRIRFAVEKKIHPVLLEALIENDSFLMLDCPVFRRLSVPGTYHHTFNRPARKRQTVNCLIIESDFSGTVPEIDPKLDFPKLDNIAMEARWLYDFLKDNQEAFNIGTIEWIRNSPENGRFRDRLQRTLNRQPWQLVHYAGHSYYEGNEDSKGGKGYLLLPSENFPDVVGLKEFSKWLRDCETQLVFLSSCHSSEEDFVFELATNKIPAIIGFRWDIDDDKAFDCAQKFYMHLFEDGQTLEYAFLETRRDMHREYPRNRIWAAPMLIIQEK